MVKLPEMLKDSLEAKRGGVINCPEGFVSYTHPSPEYLRIGSIYVLPDWKQTQVASYMVNQVCAIAADRGCSYVESYMEQEYKDQAAYLLFYGFKVSDECSRWVYFRKDV